MRRVNSISVRASNLGKAFELFLEHGQLRRPNASIVYFFINATEVDTGLIELAINLLQLTINCHGFAFLKAVEKLQLGRRTRCNLFDFILAENIRAEYLIAIEGNRNGCPHFVQNLDTLVSATAGRIAHIRFGAKFDMETPISEIRFD